MNLELELLKSFCYARHCEFVDLLFSNSQSLNRPEVVKVCFVIIIKIYKVTSN